MKYLFLFLFSASALASDCMLPFQTIVNPQTGRYFTAQDVYNDFVNVDDSYKYRYLVVNLDSAANGQCKGLDEHYPANGEWPTDLFPELNTVSGSATYQNSVLKYYRKPVNKGAIVNGNCIGQTVTMCELRGNRTIEVAKLGTSSANGSWGVPSRTYYSELMVINTRSWDSYHRAPYNESTDGVRDQEMGGVDPNRISGPRFVPYNGWNMPNFINFIPASGFAGNSQNGLHEISNGESLGSNLGAPVSHGCLRLTRYGSILLRWWVPRGARMFIHFTESGYRKFP